MSVLFAQIPSPRAFAASWDAGALVPLALVAWAALELRGSRPVALDSRGRRLAVGFGVAVLGLHLLLALGVAVTAWALEWDAEAGTRLLTNLNLVLSVGIFQALAGGLLLAATLGGGDALRDAGALPYSGSQLLPWLLPASHGVPATRRSLWGTVAESAAWLAAALAYSAVWMALARHLVGAHTAPQVQTGLEKPGGGVSVTAVAASLGLIVLAPLFEEVAFRGFLLDRVRRWFVSLVSSMCTQTRRPNESNESGNISEESHALSPRAARVAADGAAVVVTAVVWALAHGGRVEPEWVKWVQIFGLGLALGVLRLRRGLEACVVVHLLFNFPGGFLFASGP